MLGTKQFFTAHRNKYKIYRCSPSSVGLRYPLEPIIIHQFLKMTIKNLAKILSNMKVETRPNFLSKVGKYGNSDLFNYATHPSYDQSSLQRKQLELWNQLVREDAENSFFRLPLNGFEEMIQLTNQGKLWRYPIDNEQGLEAQNEVPFEDHVFLDDLIKDFPKKDYITAFMQLVICGLGRNPYISVERKRDTIKYYKDYFEKLKQ